MKRLAGTSASAGPVGASGPKTQASSAYFEPSLVVSRDGEGNPVSWFGDDTWDFRHQSYDATSGATLLFPKYEPDTMRLREQQKALIWLFMDAGKPRKLRTVQMANYTASAWSAKAAACGRDLFGALADPEFVADGIESMCLSHVTATSSLAKTLCRNARVLGFDADIPLQRLRDVITAEDQSRGDGSQTPLIPSRVYSEILSGLVASLDRVEQELPSILAAYRRSKAASRFSSEFTRARKSTHRRKELADAAERMKGLGYRADNGKALGHFLDGRLSAHQVTLMHTVAAFTGMRVGEVCILPLKNCSETFNHHGTVHYVVSGYTHKLENGVKRRATWITSEEGYRAIRLAKRIATAIHKEIGGDPAKGQEPLLFCSTTSPFKSKNSAMLLKNQKLLIDEVSPVVVQADLDELDRLELERPWERDGIEAGRRWPLAFHQLRRSLSVYAHRSGMVTLPALKAQLQHITDEMRAYYADGFSRAVNLVFDQDHFSHEWNAAKAESSFFGYTLGLLFSDDEIMGRGAERMAATIATRSRTETLKLFTEGKLAYRETVLGGCVSTDACASKPLEPIPFDCLESNCVNQVVAKNRLDFVIRTQETVVARLSGDEPGSVEHRLEVDHLRVLLQAHKNLTGRAT